MGPREYQATEVQRADKCGDGESNIENILYGAFRPKCVQARPRNEVH
jgi:hypothetical protein